MKERMIEIPKEAAGQVLLHYLNQNHHAHSAPCGGKGRCGKCTVKLIQGRFASVSNPTQTLFVGDDGSFLACQAICTEDGATIAITDVSDGLVVSDVETKVHEESAYAFALDIGTTTLALALVGCDSKQVLASVSAQNPQRGFGADVMTRIEACGNGQLTAMQSILLDAIEALIQELKDKVCISDSSAMPLSRMTVAGNPTMLHIFCGVSPCGMGKYPFTPVFLETKRLSGQELDLSVGEITVLPSASAFIGSDVLGGVLIEKMTEKEEPTLLLDIGTNGEMILCTGKKKGGRLYAASAAAGPALEGANISCGMGGVNGAVSFVKYDAQEKTLRFRTVGDADPIGLCGSGLVDLAAYLLDSEQLDETGILEEEPFCLSGYHEKKDVSHFVASCPISLTEQDIRELQLAKSAICAGVETLLEEAGVAAGDIAETYLAGGLGSYINPERAARIGLLPKALLSSIRSIGNSALGGAVYCLTSDDGVEEASRLASACQTIALNDIPSFSERFMEYILFTCEE